MKRSNAPIFWSLFGAGGVLSALAGPVLVFITGIAAPTGFGMPAEALSYARVMAFAHTLIGKAALIAIIALFLWHAAHRIYHCLHDFGVHPGVGAKVLIYGSAFLGSVAVVWLMLAIGF
jgi:fumarate reductase subunit D